MFGPGGPGQLLRQETLKPKNITETLGRFGKYFAPFWPVLIVVALLVVASTWTQVTTPDLTGQVVDCYLTQAAASSSFGNFPGAPEAAATAQSNCWLAKPEAELDLSQRIVKAMFTAGGFPAPTTDATALTDDVKLWAQYFPQPDEDALRPRPKSW